MRFALPYIIVFLASISLAVLASPTLVEENYDAEAIPDELPSDGYVAPGDGVVITNSTLVPRADPGRAFSLMQQGRDIFNIIQAVINASKRDQVARGEFTKNMIASLRNAYPGWNFVICHTKHSHKWNGAFGPDWGHWHREFDIKVGGTIGYEIYYTRSGWFKRHGDGGFMNWAYGGKVIGVSENGSRIVLGRL